MIKLGGDIAFVKVLWLMTAIFFWYLIPIFVINMKRMNKTLLICYRLFLWNMMARAVIELIMMYVFQNWHPYYGIAHDFFTFGLVALFALKLRTTSMGHIHRYFSRLLYFMGGLFLAEAYFAYYMLTNVVSNQPVYYVPSDSTHQTVFMMTWAVIGLCAVMNIFTIRKWKQNQLR